MSLDGYIADSKGGVDWLSAFEGDYGYSAFYDTIDTLIMGWTTYDQIRSFGVAWPYPGKKCCVFTTRDHPSDPNVTFIGGEISPVIEDMKLKPGKDIWLVGGAALANTFIHHSLIDEFWITVIPLLLGDGVPLFHTGNPRGTLRFLRQEQFGDVIVLQYRRCETPEEKAHEFSVSQD
jgi:dihydrofolate reductase